MWANAGALFYSVCISDLYKEFLLYRIVPSLEAQVLSYPHFLTFDEDMGTVLMVLLGVAINGDRQLAPACESGRQEGVVGPVANWPAQTPWGSKGLSVVEQPAIWTFM